MTPELNGIVRYLDGVGARYRITDIDTPGVHSPASYHYRGLALDLSGPHDPWMAEELLAVFAAFGAVENRLAELYYSGAPYGIKNGQRIRPTQSIIDTHWNHVHVAVPKGTILREAVPAVPDSPDLPNLYAPLLGFYPIFDSAGMCTGYYMVSTTGEVHSFGPGAKYYGRSEVIESP